MPGFWSRFILGSETELPSREGFECALEKLSYWLRIELRRRGLESSPPRFLGIVGKTFKERETFTDLLHDAYVFSVLDRKKALLRLARSGDIEGAIRKNVRLFLFERQRTVDPIGYRVFGITREAARLAVEKGHLEVLSGEDGEALTARSLLALPPFDPDAEPGAVDDDIVARWCESLMPDLVTSFRRQGVINRLGALIPTLADTDMSAFLLRDLVAPLKTIARSRAVALATEGAVKLGDGEDSVIEFPVEPSRELEERQTLTRLIDCLRNQIEKRRGRKEREFLRRLLDFLASWSAMMEEGATRGRPGDAEISRRLDIPRGRVPQLRHTLSQMASSCQRAGGLASGAGTPPSPAAPPRNEPMDLDQRNEALRRATAGHLDANDHSAAASDAPAPAAVVTWSGVDDRDPHQWLVVFWDEGGGQLVPVDDAPLRGSHDLDLSALAGEPLVARCGQPLEVPPDCDLEVLWQLPRGTSREAVDAVTTRLLDLAEHTPAPLEVDEDPDYLSHIEAVERARTRLECAREGSSAHRILPFATPTRPEAGPARKKPRALWVPWLATAACALIAAGLAVRTQDLQSQAAEDAQQLSASRDALANAQEELAAANSPRFVDEKDDPLYMATTRGSLTVARSDTGSSGERHYYVVTFDDAGDEFTAYELRLLDRDTGETLLSKRLPRPTPEILDFPAVARSYSLILFGLKDDGSVVEIHSKPLQIQAPREISPSP